MSLLSSDILHQVFNFFVSSDQIVDGESLRVCSLVCKQWRNIVDSRSLWVTPVGTKDHCETHDDEKANLHSTLVYRSLQIREQARDHSSSDKSPLPSLLGFTKLKYYGNKHQELYFFVEERVSGSKLLLAISRDGQKTPSHLRDVYVNHFELKGDFLLRDNNDKLETLFPSQRFPLGISIWKGRLIRWYRSETETECREIIDQIQSKIKSTSHRDLAITNYENNFSFLRHLIDLENDSVQNKRDRNVYAEGRQHMVDWMVEIVECFGLEDRTIFQAMLLFDRFTTSYDRVVNTSSLQLVAGTCLLIASKCNNIFITEKDISFCCDNLFSVANVMGTEEVVLQQLDWKLACPSSFEFSLAILRILGIPKNAKISCLCFYILEVSLAFQTSLKYKQSIIASSSLVLALYCLRDDDTSTLWPDDIAKITGFQLNDLVDCSVLLSQDIDNVRLVTSRLDMIHRRHSKPCRHNIANTPIPVLTSRTTLTSFEESLRTRS